MKEGRQCLQKYNGKKYHIPFTVCPALRIGAYVYQCDKFQWYLSHKWYMRLTIAKNQVSFAHDRVRRGMDLGYWHGFTNSRTSLKSQSYLKYLAVHIFEKTISMPGRVVRRDLRFNLPYPRRLESLTICRCHYKGSTFSSVISRPWVLVRPGFWTRDLPHASAELNQLNSTNWAKPSRKTDALVMRFVVKKKNNWLTKKMNSTMLFPVHSFWKEGW